ncbi:Shedu anti-phage system protein SduA domain-containing protein [Amycolatopsis sp. NPDC051758]|uniref:Shedu anti-phage system protein SduA domain-containing protein n=1 Tax=Amycolatopsis sp. NPDC051758 TaxID=3363935 RepID=UPI0037B43563
MIELKRANVPLVRNYRTFGLIVDRRVHEATSQVANYLTAFDEDRDAIRRRHNIDSRRATATVVIGHPGFQPELSEQEIAETLRTYNAEHARITVITYQELLDNAERSLTIDSGQD